MPHIYKLLHTAVEWLIIFYQIPKIIEVNNRLVELSRWCEFKIYDI